MAHVPISFMKVLQFFAWLIFFFATYVAFIILLQYGPFHFVEGAKQQISEIQKLVSP